MDEEGGGLNVSTKKRPRNKFGVTTVIIGRSLSGVEGRPIFLVNYTSRNCIQVMNEVLNRHVYGTQAALFCKPGNVAGN